MKKTISAKEITIILISLLIIIISTSVNATNSSLQLGNNNNNNTSTPITGDEYENAQVIEEDKNIIKDNNNTTNNTVNNTQNNNTTNNKTNNTKVYNTNNTTDLPQTGIEDYNIGILLILCITSAIYAYRKINDYKSL